MQSPFLAGCARVVASALAMAHAASLAATFPEPAALPAHGGLPDPLVLMSGERVKSARDWERRRRPELRALFQHYMYGDLPARPGRMRFETVAEHDDFLGGAGTLRLVRVTCGASDPTVIDLMVVTPRDARGRVPVFLAMNFCGNHAVSSDPRIPLTRGWLYQSCAGCTDNHATEAGRGGQAMDWPIADILARGHAFATFCSTDIDSDRGDVSDGVRATEARRRGETPTGADRGTIAAWAWGFHRCVDYLVTDKRVDARRIVAVGHSRNGKTALLAGAMDDRIALAIPHQAGCGGTAPSRGTTGESVERINRAFPHWFNARFKSFTNAPARLPFDQHALVALMAPRPVLLSNAEQDTWANPAGQFEVLKAAEPVYRLLGAGGVDATSMPPNGSLVRSRLGYYIRPGKHSMTADDWRVFMDFAEAHLGGRRR